MEFQTINSYPKYETDGTSVRSKETGKIISLKKGTNKYYLTNNEGKRVLVSPDSILKPMQPIQVGEQTEFKGKPGIIIGFSSRGLKRFAKIKCEDRIHYKTLTA